MAFLPTITRRRKVGLAVALSLMAAVPIVSSFLGAPNSPLDLGSSTILSLLEGRSPGERTSAQLTKSKAAAAVGGVPIPDVILERALGKTFPSEVEMSAVATPEQLLALADNPDLFAAPGEEMISPVDGGGTGWMFVPSVGGGGGTSGDSSSGGGSPGGGGGPSGGSPGGGSGGEGALPPVVPPAVPEPGTWATMLLGMALCGFALRRRRRPGVSEAKLLCGAL